MSCLGYVVPKGNSFATLGGTDKFTRVDVVLDESGNETGEKPWEEDEDGYGWYWKNCDNAYFPKAGMLSLFGAPQYTCEDVYYWSADPLPKALNEGWGRSCCLFNSLERLYFGVYYTGSALSDPSGLGARGTKRKRTVCKRMTYECFNLQPLIFSRVYVMNRIKNSCDC